MSCLPPPTSQNTSQDYNYRDYALRRARKGFEMARGFAPEEAEVAFAKGQQQLDLVRRQATISQLYPHQVRWPEHPDGFHKSLFFFGVLWR